MRNDRTQHETAAVGQLKADNRRMRHSLLYLASIWGTLVSAVSLVGITLSMVSAEHVELNGLTVLISEETRGQGYASGQQERLPILFILYFAIASLLFVVTWVFGSRWLRSRYRSFWFGSSAAVLLVLSFLGMVAGLLLYGLPLLVFVYFAVAKDHHSTNTIAALPDP